MTNDSPHLRLGIIGIVAISLFASLVARLYFLQVLAGPEYQVAAETNRVRIVSEPAPRGRILDAEGDVIVDNREMVVVTVEPAVNMRRLEFVKVLQWTPPVATPEPTPPPNEEPAPPPTNP